MAYHLVDKLKTALREATTPAPGKKAAKDGEKQYMDLIVCQDAYEVRDPTAALAKDVPNHGHDCRIASVYDKTELLELLKKRHGKDQPPPTDLLMDVSGGGGAPAAMEVISFLEKHYPDAPLPRINFLSLELSMALDAATSLRDSDERVPAHAVESAELKWVRNYFKGDGSHKGAELPVTNTLRTILNERLGCELPLEQKEDSYYSARLKDLSKRANNDILGAWLEGKIPAGDALKRMRDYALSLAETLRDGFYGQDSSADIPTDESFYGAAGFPKKGKAIFSLEEAEGVIQGGQRPILVMRNYDPAVIPLMAEGRIGGVIVGSTFMASHLKLMCETHMVSGLFGVMPKEKKGLAGDFNEEAAPDGPAYFEGDEATIGGQTIKRGQEILMCAGGNGLAVKPPKSLDPAADRQQKIQDDKQLKEDLKNLRLLQRCFATYFKEQNLAKHGVKVNVDSGKNGDLVAPDGVGLLRTEQMVAADRYALRYFKSFLLGPTDPHNMSNFQYTCQRHYGDLISSQLAVGKPVKIRLFDFVHSEILDKDEQKAFLDKHPRLDIHGGDALDTWPDLYRGQVRTMLKALREERLTHAPPLEIMMPAVRTEEDTLKIKKIVQEEAESVKIKPEQYSFGVMVETLDACTNIEAIAKHCDFISFGTNDLTQQHTGIGRGDLKAQARYAEEHGYNPFTKLSPEVLQIVKDVTARARKANPNIKVDICGAQAADLDTALALFDAGIDNVSVAPSNANVYGLPTLLNYHTLDAHPVPQAAPKVKAAGSSPGA